MLKDVEFKEVTELAKLDRVKIVACNAKSSTLCHPALCHTAMFEFDKVESSVEK